MKSGVFIFYRLSNNAWLFLVCSLILLQSCGFKPLYQEEDRGSINEIFNEIRIINKENNSDNRDAENIIETEYTLAKKLIFQTLTLELGLNQDKSATTKYVLEIKDIKESEYPLDLDRDGEASEYNYTVSLTATLKKDEVNNPSINFDGSKSKKKQTTLIKGKDNIEGINTDKSSDVNRLTKDKIFSKSYSSSINFNVSDNYYASQVSKRDYREILAKNIAIELKNYLLVNFIHQITN